MAQISAFEPYRYSPQAGPIENLVTQPYDKISPAMQARYLGLSPYNLVRVILGERRASDNDSDNVYTRSARHLEDWIASGVLQREPSPSLYAYFQEFREPETGETLVRKGFIGLGPVEEYSAGIVHRHEQTLSGPKKDRMELLRHTRSHFGQIFMLYPDREGSVDRLLDVAARGNPTAQLADEYGAQNRLWRISDPAKIAEIQRLMGDKKLLIADGHHRYETALAFRKDHPDLAGASQVMMTFVNMYSPGLRILATHRLVSGLDALRLKEFLAKLAPRFRVRRFDSSASLRGFWKATDPGQIRIGLVAEGGKLACLLEADRGKGELDVRVLHEEILGGALGVSEEAVRDEKYLRYARGIDTAIEAVANGSAQMTFLLEPTSIEQVADVSFSGGVMPQKSTDFYPKLLSGLTIYRL